MNKKPSALSHFFTLLFGQIAWTSPPWIKYLRTQGRYLLLGLLIFLMFFSIGYVYRHFNTSTQVRITAQITPPAPTPLAKVLIPNNLVIDFGFSQPSFKSQSVAPLAEIGKVVKEGIQLIPAFPGQWAWETDSRLVFTPKKEWPADQTYQVQFNKNVFASHVKLGSYDYSFATSPFEAKIVEFNFYQDPVNPSTHQAVATLQFNYPVDSHSLENNITLMLQASRKGKEDLNAQQFKFTLSYDEHKRTAYLHSETIPITAVERYLKLVLNKNILSSTGSGKTSEPVQSTVSIPDEASFFNVVNATSNIVHNNRGRPEQILTLETSLGVQDRELDKALHVYLLPENYPATTTQKEKLRFAWQNPGEVTPAILALSTPVTLQSLPTDRDFATLHSYQIHAPTPRYLYVQLDKGIKSFGDFSLTNNYTAVIKVADYPKEISFLHPGALLALGGEKKLSVLIRGVPTVKFEIARVLGDNINHLVTQTQGNFNNPYFINSDQFNQNNISTLFSSIQSFDMTDAGKEYYTALDLGKYIAPVSHNGGPRGLFLLTATGWDTKNKTALDVKNSRLILITDLGLIIKDNLDGSHDVFVQSITKGVPIAHVNVAILGKNGLPIMSATTNAAGRVSFTSLKDFIAEKEPTVYLATLENDVSFIPYNRFDRQLNYSRYDVGGVTQTDQQFLTAYLFSDRGIYRPGDTAHLGMIVKKAYAVDSAAGIPLEATVTDPRGMTVFDQKLTLDATGYFTLDFVTSATSPTGQYNVNLFIVKDDHPSSLLGSMTLNVSEFQPDRLRIVSRLSEAPSRGWISPNDLKAHVDLWNLYGAPATQREVTASITLSPQHVQFNEFPHYIFFDPLWDSKKPPKVFTDTLTPTKTNDLGHADFDLNLHRFDKATYVLTFFAEGFEAAGGRSVTTQTSALVSSLPFLIGYKADGDLSYIRQDSQQEIKFIAVNPQLKQQALPNLKLQVLSQHPVTALIKNPNGTYQYKSIIQTSVVSTQPFALNLQGASYILPTQTMGDFAISILDQNNTELSRFNYSVMGASQLPLSKNAELSAKLNKPEYHAGEEIELQVNAPYSGVGLITIERDKVYAYQWFKANLPNSIQKIRIPQDFQGNGYVNVTFVRDWDSPEVFTNPLSFSIAPFRVSHENQTIHIQLNMPEKARPGEKITVTYQSDKPGKIILFGVDEGILQVTRYTTPDPVAYFFQKQALNVITQQIVDQILPKFVADRELSAVGGDGSLTALKLNLNPFKRKTDLPVVFWSGIQDTDTTPRQYDYQIPDYFNGALRVMAVAVASNAVGSATKKAEIRGNFVINPNLPTFVAPQDEFDVTSSIANNVKNSGDKPEVRVTLTTTPQLEVVGTNQQNLSIGEGKEQTVHFKLRAKSLLGEAKITFVASLGNSSNTRHSTLSVRPPNAYFTTIKTGNTKDSKTILSLDRVLYPEYRNIELAISSSPLILVTGLQRYLDNFPFGCTEQLVSKAMPLLSMQNQPWFNQDVSTANQKIQDTIQMLAQRQMASGGFSYWPLVQEYESNAFASVYAMHFLTEARARGYTVSQDLFQSGLSYLKNIAAHTQDNLDDSRIRAYAIYILTRNDIVTTNYLTDLQLSLDKETKQDWKKDITSAYMAATYQLLKSFADADRLIQNYHPDTSPNKENTNFYNKQTTDAEYLYLIALHFPNLLTEKSKALTLYLVNAMNNAEMNTVFAGFATLALTAYGEHYTQETNAVPVFAVTETLINGKNKNLMTLHDTYQKINITDNIKSIQITNSLHKNYFYQMTISGFDNNIPTVSLKNGIEVEREYRDTHGNIIDKIELGKEIEVHIHIRSLTNDYLNNIAILDLLPGGFEVVQNSIHNENMDYEDAREDRVIFFGSIHPDTQEIIYRIKATNIGKYTVPPIFANSMYNPELNSRSAGGQIIEVQ